MSTTSDSKCPAGGQHEGFYDADENGSFVFCEKCGRVTAVPRIPVWARRES